MSPLHPLNTIIKEVKKSEASSQAKIKSSSKKVVVINKRDKKIISKIPFFSGKDIVYYSVLNNNDATHIAECKKLLVEITEFAQNRKLDISVAYRASCPAGQEDTVIKALCGDDSPGVELDKKIKTWIVNLTNDKVGEYIDKFSDKVEDLQNNLKTNIEPQVGLKIDFRLSIEQGVQLNIKIPTQGKIPELTVYVSDSDEPLDLQLKTELIVNDQAKAKANLKNDGKIPIILLTKQEIKKYLLENTTLSQFYYELKDTVRNGLVDHLNKVLAEKGWQIAYLYLDSKTVASSPLPKELVEIQHTVDCKVQKYAKLVSVENTLQMLPQDVRRYISAQSPNLEVWVESKLEKIIKTLLLEKKYAEILEDFHQESEAIKQEMEAEAASIGYAIKHIVSLPQLEHTPLKEKIEIKDEKAQFSTNQSGIKIELTTTVTLRFDTFAKIEDDLDLTVDEIRELIKETVNSTNREILRTIDPERFYMRFYEPLPQEKSVEEELKEAITKALEDRFGAEVGTVVPIPEETVIIDYLQRLMGMIGSFECQIPSLTGGDVVKFQGDFKIITVGKGSWYTFQSRFQSRQKSQSQLREELEALEKQYSREISLGVIEEDREGIDTISQRIRTIESEIFGLDDIKQSIEKSINAKLMTVDSEVLMYRDIKHLSTMEKYINQWARESVIEQHGLDISILHLTRTRTEQEKYLFDAQQQLEKAKIDEARAQLEAKNEQRQKQLEMSSRRDQAKYDELNKLYEQRSKLIAYGETDSDERKSLDKEISRLEKEILKPSLEEAENSLKLLQPKKAKAKRFLEFEEQMSPLSSQTPQDSDSSSNANVSNQEEEDLW